MLVNGGAYYGYEVLKEETLDYATRTHSTEMDGTLQEPTRWGMGFGVGGEPLKDQLLFGNSMGSYSTASTFGHAGQRSSTAWADKTEQLVMTFTTNRLVDQAAARQRVQSLADAVWESLVEHQNLRLR